MIELTLSPAGAGEVCASILAELPQWFGIPESNAAYADLAEREPAWLALDDGRPVGVMILKTHGEHSLENYLLGVRPSHHRSGLGRAFIERARQIAEDGGARYLTVKTLGPSRAYEPYERTRAFYRAVGFTPLEEFTEIWGPENPCLFMVKPVLGLPL
jgi:GNAT superfamily N-acetyltransferase